MNTGLPNKINTVCWQGDSNGHLEIQDQTKLPTQISHVVCKDVSTVVESIQSLRVRGAPAIGIAGAYGMVLAIHQAIHLEESSEKKIAYIQQRAEDLATSRPTAVNLRWAIQRIESLILNAGKNPDFLELSNAVLDEAKCIQKEDQRLCEKIGEYGASILPDGDLLTHCNTGALATGGIGTALGVIVTAWEQGRRFHVFADETRPLLQGARLTAWELTQRKIPVTVLADAAAAHLLKTGLIGCCIVGADRITANGDTANKIGTYGLALLAKAHNIPFFVAAPSTTFDLTLQTGDEIPIEERDENEILQPFGFQSTPATARGFNPAFDVTPADLITAIITERGIIKNVTIDTVAAVISN
ncbi:MAG TPA: S-methyl-5-thioribose-1-phosphate isomerase [Planctomycetaceae bacterium]|nr:S-methyl-5-thioribose-1-phosphate isomerase [Planctomycetaceae bacterium]